METKLTNIDGIEEANQRIH